jgi:hypothetical protein
MFVPRGRVSVVVVVVSWCGVSLIQRTTTSSRTTTYQPILNPPRLDLPYLPLFKQTQPMSFTLTRRALQSTTRITTTALNLRTMSSNPAISNPAKSETENRGPQFGFKERQPEQEEKKVMDDILNLCEFALISLLQTLRLRCWLTWCSPLSIPPCYHRPTQPNLHRLSTL